MVNINIPCIHRVDYIYCGNEEILKTKNWFIRKIFGYQCPLANNIAAKPECQELPKRPSIRPVGIKSEVQKHEVHVYHHHKVEK